MNHHQHQQQSQSQSQSQQPIPSAIQIKEHKRLMRINLIQFLNSLPIRIMVSVFNTNTLTENREFVEKNKHRIQCIYCSPVEMSKNIPNDCPLTILEMNNTTNQIVGIGLVMNRPKTQEYNVYGDGNYNRFQFLGKKRIDRKDMNDEEERIMKIFDNLCFTGNQHLKRGQGLKSFPVEMLYKVKLGTGFDLVNFIYEMFKRRKA